MDVALHQLQYSSWYVRHKPCPGIWRSLCRGAAPHHKREGADCWHCPYGQRFLGAFTWLPTPEYVCPDLLEMKTGASTCLYIEISLHKYSIRKVFAYCKAARTDFWGRLSIIITLMLVRLQVCWERFSTSRKCHESAFKFAKGALLVCTC